MCTQQRSFAASMLLAGLIGLTGCKRPESEAGAGPDPVAREPAGALAAAGPTPNIVLLMIDTLRADRVGVYGQRGGLTPTIDALGAEGVVFERAIAPAPWTQPSIASLFCGQYPGVHRVTDFNRALRQTSFSEAKAPVFDESFVTLAEQLQGRGYATAAFVANPFILREFGFAQGFDHFDATRTGNGVPGSVINDAALAWLQKRDPGKPFFVYLHYMDVHGPYTFNSRFLAERLDAVEAAPDKHKLSEVEFRRLEYLTRVEQPPDDMERHKRLSIYREYWQARYDAGVRELDEHLGELRAELTTMDLWKNTYVIVAADHGEELCERGFWDHGTSVYHTELRVPLVLRWPGRLPAGKRVTATVRLIDLLPTLLDQLDMPRAPVAQGVSLVPLIAGAKRPPPHLALAEATRTPPEQKAIHLGVWKMVQFYDTGRCELYDLATDPVESHDLSAEFPERLEALQALLSEQLAENARVAQGHEVRRTPISPELLEKLRDLGYTGN